VVEQQRYEVVEALPGGVQIRSYTEHQVVSVDVRGSLSDAPNLGFSPLVSYISGYNLSGQKIAMTAPVIQAPESAGQHRISFVLPHIPQATWPEPADPRVRLETKFASLVAALGFRGYWRERHVVDQNQKLLDALEGSRYSPSGEPYFARYDPPSVPGLFRRNEVLVAITTEKSR
jgi:hypothetical protein